MLPLGQILPVAGGSDIHSSLHPPEYPGFGADSEMQSIRNQEANVAKLNDSSPSFRLHLKPDGSEPSAGGQAGRHFPDRAVFREVILETAWMDTRFSSNFSTDIAVLDDYIDHFRFTDPTCRGSGATNLISPAFAIPKTQNLESLSTLYDQVNLMRPKL